MKPLVLVAVIAGVAAGLAIGHRLWSRPAIHFSASPGEPWSEAQRTELKRIEALLLTAGPGNRCASISELVGSEAFHAEITRAVREALAGNSPSRSSGKEPKAANLQPTPENEQAYRSGQDLIDTALAHRSWGDDEAAELRKLLDRTDGKHRMHLVKKLVPALNAGNIAVDLHGPPF